MNNNVITLVGKAVGEFEFAWEAYGEKFYTFKLETIRTSGAKDVLVICCSDKTIRMDAKILGKSLGILGEIRTLNICDSVGKTHVDVKVFANEMYAIDVQNDSIGEDICDLHGYLCKIGRLRETPFGRKICDVILAVHRDYGKSDYIPCIFWGRNAECVSNMKQGMEMSINGRLQSREYIKDDELHTVYEVSAQSFEVAE